MKKNTCCASTSGLFASHISKAPCTWLKWYAQVHDIKWLACLRDDRGIQSTNEQPALPSRGHMTSFPKGFSHNQNAGFMELNVGSCSCVRVRARVEKSCDSK
eukprot:Skav204048  [mRNA]  locus=scaffold3:224044:224949:+ [translate_table: standard]